MRASGLGLSLLTKNRKSVPWCRDLVGRRETLYDRADSSFSILYLVFTELPAAARPAVFRNTTDSSPLGSGFTS